MRRRTLLRLLGLCALVAVAVPLVGYSVPSCFAPAGGQVSAECISRWEAGMSPFPDRFVYVLGAPMSAIVTFLVLAGGALVFMTLRRTRRPAAP